MNIKKYIAIFLVLLFTVKSMAIDGKALVYFFDSTTTIVNPNCKKANGSTSSEKNNFAEKFSDSSITMGCITLFDIKTSSWTQVVQESIFSPFDYLTLQNGVIYKKSNYPPPRI